MKEHFGIAVFINKKLEWTYIARDEADRAPFSGGMQIGLDMAGADFLVEDLPEALHRSPGPERYCEYWKKEEVEAEWLKEIAFKESQEDG
jgi:hypothetical protein